MTFFGDELEALKTAVLLQFVSKKILKNMVFRENFFIDSVKIINYNITNYKLKKI